jgi:hypothetical protein
MIGVISIIDVYLIQKRNAVFIEIQYNTNLWNNGMYTKIETIAPCISSTH